MCRETFDYLWPYEGNKTRCIEWIPMENKMEPYSSYIHHHMWRPRRQAQRLCTKCSVGLQSNLKPGKHLRYDHPAMQQVRDYVAFQVEGNHCHPALVANFDQVWSLNWRPRKRTLVRKGGEDGVDDIARSMSLRRARHCIERFLNRPLTEKMGNNNEPVTVKPADLQGKGTSCVPVEGFRQPHTLTTLSWSCGQLGRGFVTCKEDFMSERLRAELNQDQDL